MSSRAKYVVCPHKNMLNHSILLLILTLLILTHIINMKLMLLWGTNSIQLRPKYKQFHIFPPQDVS